jgi:serine/threonine protein kinase
MAETDRTLSLQANLQEATIGYAGAGDSAKIESFGDYELTAEIARGGMGIVLRGRQIRLNRPVAVKMLLAGTFASGTDRERFRHEAEAAAGLEHPHILPVYEVGEHAGRAFFSMKFVAGGTLAERLAQKPRPPARELVELLTKICRAVDYAHRRGILHRDLKPSNVLLDVDGTPYVADFGLAKRTDSDDMLTRTGTVVGTPSYMAPEQARGDKGLTTAADIYSLAAILYEILAGRPPFVGDTIMATLRKVIDDAPMDPRSTAPEAEGDLCVVALKGLEKEPGRRYATAAALADDLERWLRGEAVFARPLTRSERTIRWMKKNRGLTALAGGLAAALVVGTVVSTLFAIRANEQKNLADQNAREMNAALVDASRAKEAALMQREIAEDVLCRSRYEEARALRLAGIPGWRSVGLDRLRESAQLRIRLRENSNENQLPALAELRGEAITTLSRNDAILVRTIPSGINDNPIVSGDGKLLFNKFFRAMGSTIFGIRGIDLESGSELFSHEMDFSPAKMPSLKTDAGQEEYVRRTGFFNGNLAVNSTGSLAVCGASFGGDLCIFETRTAKYVRSLKTSIPKNSGGVFSAQAFSNDDRYILAWHQEPKAATLFVWETERDAPARELVRLPLAKPDPGIAPHRQ